MTRLSIAFCALLAMLPVPALAMHWGIYAPDESGSRYWIDRDSIVEKNDGYTYFTWLALGEDSVAPTSPSGNQWAIKCATGESLKLVNGNWVAGPHFGNDAYLFKFLCEK